MNDFALIIKPDEEEPDAAQVLVDGTVDRRPYRFLLDTGAASSCIQLDDYTALFSAVGEHRSAGVFADSHDDLITVPSLTLGPISKRDFPLARVAGKDPAISNLIGMDLLKDFRCHFFFDENRVAVNAGDDLPAGIAFQTLWMDRRFHPYVDVQCGTFTAQAVWDTGASLTIVDMSLVNRHPAFFQAAGRSSGTDSSGATVETPMFIMAATTLGGHTFPPHRVAGVDLSYMNASIEIPMDLILGYSTLRKANWVFDFPRKQWAISKSLFMESK
jgi:hypothetical protein